MLTSEVYMLMVMVGVSLGPGSKGLIVVEYGLQVGRHVGKEVR
jgi:hypothetical protein